MADGGDLIEVTRGGRALRFRPCGGRIEGLLRANAFYEQQMLDYIEALALPGVYADVGAYVGTHALFFAAFTPASRVLAFEPRPHVLEHLRVNVTANPSGERVVILPFGLSDRDETVCTVLDGQPVSFACRPLDAVTEEPIALIKLDVEGMESKVLVGASGVLARSRPLLFAEAHDPAALDALVAALAPHGYRPTGRVFNDTATYELTAAGSEIEAQLPSALWLGDPSWWISDHADLTAEVSNGVRIVSRLKPEQVGHLTASPARLTRPPRESFFVPTRGETFFLQVSGRVSRERSVWIYLMEYRADERTHVQRHWITPHMFQRIELQPDTERVRVVLRVTGSADLELERIAIHALAARP